MSTVRVSHTPKNISFFVAALRNAAASSQRHSSVKRAESPVDCSVTKRSRHMSNDGAPMVYQVSYAEPRVSPETTTPPSSSTEEKRVIVPADPEVWTQDHVRQWLDWAIKEYVLEEVDVMLFQALDGKALCKMTKDDMMRLTSAYNADMLLSHLNYLRQSSPTFSYSTTPTNNTPPQQPRLQVKAESDFDEISRRNSWPANTMTAVPKGSSMEHHHSTRVTEPAPRIVQGMMAPLHAGVTTADHLPPSCPASLQSLSLSSSCLESSQPSLSCETIRILLKISSMLTTR
uniref:Friend leukemia integration 1 transcription factor-like isoform X2 n=1 Tax=Solea senegalensis TaxID=28829 RepID=UPI001CD85C48|nr:Friend leukemia integration 1 transcription factor-like isoform X2 [Solea senegalensis]